MNLGVNRIIGAVLSTLRQINYVPVRHRYYAEKIARGPHGRKFGYNDKVFYKGVLPRIKDGSPLPIPIYRPGNSWNREKALAGQNDYIDLLGDGKLKPYEVSYDVPKWLRGRKGNEMKLLLLKQKIYSKTQYEYDHPSAWFNIRRRIKYLYRFMNLKTKTSFSKQ